jgi:rubrerythrin
VSTPKNDLDPIKVSVPASLAEACKAAMKAEEANIALYDSFLEYVKEADIKDVFVRLRTASKENHLPAFTRCSLGGGPGLRHTS